MASHYSQYRAPEDRSSRSKWVAEALCEIYGLRISVRTDDGGILSQLLLRMPPATRLGINQEEFDWVICVRAKANLSHGFELYTQECLVAQTSDFDDILNRFESNVGIYVAENACDRVFIHAGCVAWNGHGIVIPGRSYSGKSTLVEAFLRAGATYYSDEYCVLDASGLAHAYPRPLSMRMEGGRRMRPTAQSLGANVGDAAISVALVISTHYQQGNCWRPIRTTPGQIVFSLLDNAVSARTKPATVLTVLTKLAESAQGFSGIRGEADAVVQAILSGQFFSDKTL